MKLINRLCLLVGCFMYQAGWAQPQTYELRKQEAEELIAQGHRWNRPQTLAEGYFRLGKLADGIGDFQQAKSWFQKARLLYLKQQDKKNLARVLNRLSSIAYKEKNHMEARQLIFQMIEVSAEIKDTRLLAIGLVSKSMSDVEWSIAKRDTTGLFNRVFSDFKKAKQVGTSLEDEAFLADMNLGFAGMFLTLHHPELALELYLRLKKFYDTQPFQQPKLIYYLNTADAYLALQMPNKAYEYLTPVRKIVDDSHYPDYSPRIRYHEVVSQYFTRVNQPDSALHHLKIWKNLIQEFTVQENIKNQALANSQRNLQANRVELDIAKEKIQVEKKLRYWQQIALFILLTFLLLLAGLILYLIKLSTRYRKLSQQNDLLVREQSHRMKNNLQMVSSLLSMQARMAGDPRMVTMIDEVKLRLETMVLLHKQVYSNQELLKTNFRELVVRLIEAAQVSFGISNLSWSIEDWEDEFEFDQGLLVILILNELITNACKYAFNQHSNPELLIRLIQEEGNWQVMVQDNGMRPISNPDLIHQKQTFGFRMISLLLDQLGGRWEYRYENGSTFLLYLPKHETHIDFDRRR
ncbi:MAG: sensor histidine kinase [Spirosomataceae bacterium]